MENRHNKIITSHWLRSSLILVLLYFSQSYSFDHLHHVHGLFEFEISSHSVVVDGENLSDHDGDHQHEYDRHIDWHILRTRSQHTVVINDQYIVSLLPFILSDDNDASYIVNEDILFIDDSSLLSLIIRGPPFFG